MLESAAELAKRILADQMGFSVLLGLVLVSLLLLCVAYCIFVERKIAAWIQDRYGPNRVGPRGLLQPVADGLKSLFKEEYVAPWADVPLYILAPAILFVSSLVTFAVIPWAGQLRWPWMDETRTVSVQVASLDVGLLYMIGLSGLGVYGLILAGWASNSKYPFLGGIRSAAQMLSYEVPLGLGIMAVVLTFGTLRLEEIVSAQAGMWQVGGIAVLPAWGVFLHPVSFLVVLTCAFAETNRLPFDLPEAEQELVGGYHTEYSGMKLGMFFLAEYAHMITISALMCALFLGGWHAPWLDGLLGGHRVGVLAAAGRFVVYCLKVAALMFFFMWVRWTLPRFRYDQLMRLAWKGLVPLGLGCVAWTGLLTLYGRTNSWLCPLGEIAIFLTAVLAVGLKGGRISGRQPDLEGRFTVSRAGS